MSNSSEKKYKYWVVTIMSNSSVKLPSTEVVVSCFKSLCSEYTFQQELAESGMLHYQCAVATKIRKRCLTLVSDIAELLRLDRSLVFVDRAQDYDTAKVYSSAEEKRVSGSLVYSNITPVTYSENDIKLLDDKDKRYPWQNTFMHMFFDENQMDYLPSDSRTIYWIVDTIGNSGKSTFIKWLHQRYMHNTKISFGSSTQIRTSIIEKGAKKLYFLDVPRTLGSDDSMKSIYNILEDISNGYIETAMHGNPRELVMDPPHLVVFSNIYPQKESLSLDRWKIYKITYGMYLELV